MRILCVLAAACPILAPTHVAGGPPRPVSAAKGDLPDTDRARFAARFAREIWPMMAEPAVAEKGCLACHRDDENNTSAFVLSDDPVKDFAALLSDGYFDRGNPASVLAKVAHKRPRSRMPPVPARPWSREEIGTLRRFIEELEAKRRREDR
jgi:hypothetical protein